jgi:hypothetical protein
MRHCPHENNEHEASLFEWWNKRIKCAYVRKAQCLGLIFIAFLKNIASVNLYVLVNQNMLTFYYILVRRERIFSTSVMI